MDVRIVDDPARVVADLLIDVACAGGHVALAGGSTPRRAYELAAAGRRRPQRRDAVAGRRARRAARRRALQRAGWSREALTERIPEERRPRLMEVETELGPDAAAADYESRLREELGNHPRLDLVLLGLGPDSHTASLFPGKPALSETHRLVTARAGGRDGAAGPARHA